MVPLLPVLLQAAFAIAALSGLAEQVSWPSFDGLTLDELLAVRSWEEAVAVVRPVLLWPIKHDVHYVMSGWDKMPAKAELHGLEVAERRLQRTFGVSCTQGDKAARVQLYNKQCEATCGRRPYQVEAQNCAYDLAGTCLCDATCACAGPGSLWLPLVVVLVENLVWVALMFLVACCLWGSIKEAGQPNPIPLINGQTDFESGVCDCFDDIGTCCCGCWCPIIRASQTAHAASIRYFWYSMLIFGFAFMLPLFIGWAVIFWVIRVCYRMKLRQRAGLQENSINDCCCTLFCGPCTNCQEARHMEKAILLSKSGSQFGGGGGPVGTPVGMVQGQVVGTPVQGQVVVGSFP